jgi:hypothetical protein
MKQISSLDKDGYSWINLGYHSWISSGICSGTLNLDKRGYEGYLLDNFGRYEYGYLSWICTKIYMDIKGYIRISQLDIFSWI